MTIPAMQKTSVGRSINRLTQSPAAEQRQSVTFAGLTSRAVAPDDDVVFCVEPINRSGNPVILTVRFFRSFVRVSA